MHLHGCYSKVCTLVSLKKEATICTAWQTQLWFINWMNTFVLVARAREDTEKIDHDVKKRAERLHHVATVRNLDFVSVPKSERNGNLWSIFVLVTGADSEKHSWIKIEKSCRQALEWWCIRGLYFAISFLVELFSLRTQCLYFVCSTYPSSSWVTFLFSIEIWFPLQFCCLVPILFRLI